MKKQEQNYWKETNENFAKSIARKPVVYLSLRVNTVEVIKIYNLKMVYKDGT